MTGDLSSLVLSRANLPRFPGATVPEQLTAGRDAALRVLLKYVPTMQFDPDGASAVLRQISTWEERNRDTLAKVLGDPNADALPDQIRVSLGSDKAKQFIIAIFTQAAIGLGPWLSGAVANEAQTGQLLNENWARTDAETRLQAFGGIVKMEQDGHLAKFFGQDTSTGTQGFGALPVVAVVAIVVAAVALAAVLLTYLYSAKRLEQNNKLMSDLCARAQQTGDQATLARCIEAAEGLQKEDPFPWLSSLTRSIGVALVASVVTFVAVRYGLPVLLTHSERRSRRLEAYT